MSSPAGTGTEIHCFFQYSFLFALLSSGDSDPVHILLLEVPQLPDSPSISRDPVSVPLVYVLLALHPAEMLSHVIYHCDLARPPASSLCTLECAHGKRYGILGSKACVGIGPHWLAFSSLWVASLASLQPCTSAKGVASVRRAMWAADPSPSLEPLSSVLGAAKMPQSRPLPWSSPLIGQAAQNMALSRLVMPH